MDLSLDLFGGEQRLAEIDTYHGIPPVKQLKNRLRPRCPLRQTVTWFVFTVTV
jgi:hypothetical protein